MTLTVQPCATCDQWQEKWKAEVLAHDSCSHQLATLQAATRAMMKRWITMGPWPWEEVVAVQDALDGTVSRQERAE